MSKAVLSDKRHDLLLTDESRRFLDQWADKHSFQLLFDELDDVFFFAKDEAGHLLVMNKALAQRFAQILGRPLRNLIGLTDFDLHPTELADQYREDDRLVMTTGKPLIGRVEMWYNDIQELDWSVTNKVPVFDSRGIVIGVMGTVRSYQARRGIAGRVSFADRIVKYIQKHHQDAITVQQIARRSGLSVRQLHRKFCPLFSMSVQEFIVRTRLQSAKTALMHSDSAISQIALDCGFYDQSSMTRLFRKYIGMTPLKFRKRYRTLS
jgi:AraC-like DNA-binding protein